MNPKEHASVSTLTLDVYWASGRSGDPALEAHVTECERCQAYLAGLAALEGPALPALSGPPKPAPATPIQRRWRRVTAMAGGALALAASLVLVLRTRPTPLEGYVGIKGTPAVQVLVHRDLDTRVWDGQSPVRPGDALALRVACEGLRHVAVAAPGPGGWVRLSDAPCPTESAPLPFTLVVDGEPGEERLALVLSEDPIDEQTLRAAIEETRRTGEVWAVQFVLPKTIEVPR
jgi:hypothetical protein